MFIDLRKKQIQAVSKENVELVKCVRLLQVKLDDTRNQNTKIIEKITASQQNQPKECANILLCSTDLMTSLCVLQILKLKTEIKEYEAELSQMNIGPSNELMCQYDQLCKKRDNILLSQKSLQEELNQLKEDSAKEKAHPKTTLQKYHQL